MNITCSANLRNYSLSVGVPLPEVLSVSGDIKRFHIKGEKRGSFNGWYVVNFARSVYRVVFGSWRTGETFKWNNSSDDRPSVTDLYLAKKRKAAKEKQKRDKQISTAVLAEREYKRAQDASASHPYLIRKNISPIDVRQIGNRLVLPIYSEPDQIVNLQYIWPNGDKRFEKGGRKKGCYGKVGKSVTDDALLCEGYATAVSLHKETELTVFWGIDAGNLESAAKNLKSFYPSINFKVCADNDRYSSSGQNIGVRDAQKAQKVFNEELPYIPQFQCTHCKCSDFNDLVNCTNNGGGYVGF